MLVVDVSNFIGELTPEDCIALRRAGIQRSIVGLQYPGPSYPPGVAHQQIPALIAAGIPPVACYAESTYIADAWPHVAHLKRYIPQVFLACETDEVNQDYVARSLAYIDALDLPERAGIYTGAWWWVGKPFAALYGDRDLWLAQYDKIFDMRIIPLGPWDAARYKQCIGGVHIGRLIVDLSISESWGEK